MMTSPSFSMEQLERHGGHARGLSSTDMIAFIKPQFLGIIIPDDHDKAEAKMEWLRSQIIGTDVDTPFGKHILTCADHIASGRSLRYIEDYIAQKVLPYYGNTHTDDSHVMSKMVHDSHYVKKCMGGGHDDVILFCGSGTTAAIKRQQEVMGLAVRSIMRERVPKTLREEERWVVFIGLYEHHSNILSWRHSLAEVVEIGMDGDGLVDMDVLTRELGNPKFQGTLYQAMSPDL